ncbi:hypothetical protein [Novosphingobium album (ex Hu et al. 2023)]|uniref:Chorismate lyase n=1 Tax=Novosphingobium album (ex Hu et al. 2023) TaxID=2930093 RepID=A0ABT0B137_9SPHN|nr:hypothetical protein [Novosphingobium album (ex Hu et al. 2023)]MCJ2178791.1 hypothetical protein [Novosphingobium album (ex Hu et al. 2023)]
MTDQTVHPTIEAFEATLRRHESATLALEEWCAARGMANPARVTAHSVEAGQDQPERDVSDRLQIAADEAVAMRHVELRCGQAVLSRAWNWFVPDRLTPDMRTALQASDIPFGKVVAPLHFRRQPLETVRGQAEHCPEGTISTHRAMLILPDGKPLAYLIECYTTANLAGS